jgi:SSS family solute:Na+ symporter
MPSLETNFSWLDWGIVACYLLGTVAVGLYVNRFIRNMSDYVVAGRAVRTWLAVATMTGSELGLVTVMFAAQKGFTGGFSAFHIAVVAGVVPLVVGFTGFIVVPLRRLGVMTIPQYYGIRFGQGVRVYGGILLAAAGILNMGMFLKAGAIFVTALTGLNEPAHVNIVMTVLILLVLIYTTLGGMVSVIITDYIQFVVLSFGLLLACAIAVGQLGWGTIVGAVQEVHGEAGFNPAHEDGFGISYMAWMLLTAGLVSSTIWQTAVMRASSVESEAVVRSLYKWSSVGFLIRFLLPQFLGICALTYFMGHPEARALFLTTDGGVVNNPELTMSAFPHFLGQILPIGIIGIVGAGMLAAFMSTHDSYLLCWASVIVEDVVVPLWGGRMSTRSRLLLARVLIVLIGIFLLVWSLWYPLGQDLLDYMMISGAIYFTGALALLVLGIYWKGASRVGAYMALTAGGLAVLGLTPVQEKIGFERLENLLGMKLSTAHVGLFVTALALVLMVLGSLLFPDKGLPADDREVAS